MKTIYQAPSWRVHTFSERTTCHRHFETSEMPQNWITEIILYSIKLNLKIVAQKMYITKAEVTLFQVVCPAKWSVTLKLQMHNKWAHTCYLSLLLSAKWRHITAWENYTYNCVMASIQPTVNKLVNHWLLLFLIIKVVPNNIIIYKSYTL